MGVDAWMGRREGVKGDASGRDTLHVIFMLEGMFCRKALIFFEFRKQRGQ